MLYIGCAVLVLVAIAGMVVFFDGLVRLVRGHPFNGMSRALGGLVLLFVAAFITLLALDLRTYFELTYEQPVAIVRFRALGPQYFRTRLSYGGNRVIETDLHGDEWELDARIIKWRGFANILGLKTLYRLDRLSGRYRSVRQERTAIHSAVSLGPATWLDSWSLMHRCQRWLPWLLDASYGSGTYLPMANGAEYRVTLSTTGLLARPENAAARQALENW
ncbi:MAG: cation/multidrug efflux pump [Gammaproteobacteria bacterium]